MLSTIYLKAIPEDVVRAILETQMELKMKNGTVRKQYSQCQAIFHIVREHKKLTDKK